MQNTKVQHLNVSLWLVFDQTVSQCHRIDNYMYRLDLQFRKKFSVMQLCGSVCFIVSSFLH